MLEVEDLTKLHRRRKILDGVSLVLRPGTVVGLLGPNGAGKTTCFHVIIGLLRADGGAIRLSGRDITDLPMHRRARKGIGYLPQEPSIFRQLTVRANIRSILEMRKDLDRRGRRAELERLFDELQIGHLARQLGITLSGGERRRVEIARALAANPRHILLDEPFAGIDPVSVADVKRMVRHLTSRGIGVLITDHNVRETLDICDRGYILNEGRILAYGPADRIIEDPAVREIYLGSDFTL